MPFAQTDRLSLHYDTMGTGTPAVLLVHELGGNCRSFGEVMPDLARRTSVFAVDLRGYGLSEKPPGPREMEDYADDLAAFVTAMRLGVVDVVGIAMGGMMGALMAVHHPQLVRRLVVCEGTDAISEKGKQNNIERAKKIRAEGMRAVAAPSLKNSFPDQHAAARERYMPAFLANDPFAYAEACEALARMRAGPGDFARIRAPTLVITGELDTLWPPEAGQRLAACIPGSRFHVLPGAGHFPHLQTPQQFLRLTESFLAG